MGISINDVQKMIGSNSNNLGYLCTSDYINPWSKYKPVSAVDPVYDIKLNQNYRGENMCNIQFVHASSIADAISKLDMDKTAKYVKIAPELPKRLGDFRDYEATAQQPYSELLDREYATTNEHALNIEYRWKDNVYESFNLTYPMIYPNYKIAGLIVNSGNQFVALASSLHPLSTYGYENYNLIPSHSVYDKNEKYKVYSVLIAEPFPYTFETDPKKIKCNDIVLLELQPYNLKFINPDKLSLKVVVTDANPATGEFCNDTYCTNLTGKDYNCQYIKFEIIEEEWDEELQDTFTSVSESWTQDLSGWVIVNGKKDDDLRIGGCTSIKNFKPQCTYYLQATMRFLDNIDDLVSARVLIC